jgi:phage FluMu gp28-like protein
LTSENGGKTVNLADWKPPHDCTVVYTRWYLADNFSRATMLMSWPRPKIRGMARQEYFRLEVTLYPQSDQSAVFKWLDHMVNDQVDAIVDRDSRYLLARQPHSAFKPEVEQLGELCPI